MQKILLRPLLHRNSECIGIYFDKNIDLEKIIRRQPAVKWSQTNKCWYIPLTQTAYQLLVKELKEKAIVDNSELKAYLEKKRKVRSALPEKQQPDTKKKTAFSKPVALSPALQLSTANLKALENFVEHLQLKAYSNATINTYRNEFMQLLQVLKNMSRPEIG